MAIEAKKNKVGKARGFTLIEVLIVIVLFSGIALIITQILFTTLQSSTKSEFTSQVRQSADNVLAVMERSLRNAQSIESCGGQQVSYLDQGGNPSSFSCQNVGNSGYVASGSAQITPNDVAVTSCSINCEDSGGATRAVKINLSFSYTGQVSQRPSEQANVNVETRVLLRN